MSSIKGEGVFFRAIRLPGDRESWLAQRKLAIGGSDIAALMGISPYKGPYSVYVEKIGLVEPPYISDKPAVHWGNTLEPVLLAEYRQRHPDRMARRVNAILQSIERPHAQASLDGEVYDPETGDWGVLEIKTAGLMRESDWADGVPLYYLTQVQHYLYVTGRKWCDVIVLIGGQVYREHRVYRDEEDIAAICEAIDRFWHHVEDGTEPEIFAQDAAAVLATVPEGEAESVHADVDPLLVAAWLHAKESRDAADKVVRDCAERIKHAMGSGTVCDAPGGRELRWGRGQQRRTFDTKAFERDHPDLYKQYVTVRKVDAGLRAYKRKDK